LLSSQLRDGVVDPRRNGNRPSVFRFIERIAFWQAERVIPLSATASSALRGRRCSSGACGAQARRTPLQLGCGPSQTLSQTDDVGHQHVPHWSMRLGHLENTTWCLGATRVWGWGPTELSFSSSSLIQTWAMISATGSTSLSETAIRTCEEGAGSSSIVTGVPCSCEQSCQRRSFRISAGNRPRPAGRSR
jgi:hypothetical protein